MNHFIENIEDTLDRLDHFLGQVPDEQKLEALNLVLDGTYRRKWEGERQKLDPWGSWMHSTYLDTSPMGWHEDEESRERLYGPEGANLIYSRAGGCKPGSTGCIGHNDEGDLVELHIPMFDIDLPMRVVPSTNPGKGHLYIKKPMPWEKIEALLAALVEAGVVHRNYLKHSQARGYTCLRPAFVSKPANYNDRFGSTGDDEDQGG